MASKVEEYCSESGVHGILVTLPDPSVLDALQTCEDNNIPIAVFNAGLQLAQGSVGLGDCDAWKETIVNECSPD